MIFCAISQDTLPSAVEDDWTRLRVRARLRDFGLHISLINNHEILAKTECFIHALDNRIVWHGADANLEPSANR